MDSGSDFVKSWGKMQKEGQESALDDKIMNNSRGGK